MSKAAATGTGYFALENITIEGRPYTPGEEIERPAEREYDFEAADRRWKIKNPTGIAGTVTAVEVKDTFPDLDELAAGGRATADKRLASLAAKATEAALAVDHLRRTGLAGDDAYHDAEDEMREAQEAFRTARVGSSAHCPAAAREEQG